MAKLLIAIYVLITSSALIVLKLGTKHGAPIQMVNQRLQLHLTPLNVTGIILYGMSFLTYTYLISRYELGYIIPLTTALVYIIIFTASFIVFKESFTVIKVAGIALIVIGLMLLNIKK